MRFFLLVINSKLGPNSYRLATKTRTDLQGHPRSMIFTASEKTCNFLLMFNSNFASISHRF